MWRESLCVGVDIIDNQHKQLFKKIEELLLEVNNKSVRNKVECISTIIFLKDYVVKHFADEEACMKSINYEDFEYHKALHEKFITTVAQHEKKMLASDFSDNDVKEFVGTLVAWVLYHVSEEDQRIVVEAPKKEILAVHSDLIFICACDVINKIAGFDLEKMDKADTNHVELNDSLIVEVAISGGISGYINLVYSFSFIQNLIIALMGSFSGAVDELATSALLEISHIMSINICGKIAKEKGVTCDVKPPVIVEKSIKMLSERVAIDTGEGIIEIGLSIS